MVHCITFASQGENEPIQQYKHDLFIKDQLIRGIANDATPNGSTVQSWSTEIPRAERLSCRLFGKTWKEALSTIPVLANKLFKLFGWKRWKDIKNSFIPN